MFKHLTETRSNIHLVETELKTAKLPLGVVSRMRESSGLAELSAEQLRSMCSPGSTDNSLEFALMVARGLSDTPRRLDSRFLYDAQGSYIFERICEQPEYYLTRTEAAILASSAAEITECTGPVTLVELGSGSSIKTQLLLEAYCERHGSMCYTPVDISKAILAHAEQEITSRYPLVSVQALHGTYDEAYPLLGSMSPSMLLFLGSNVGNLDSHQAAMFWDKVSCHLNPGDYCLLGIDINVDANSLDAAYNDKAGYSQAFTRNLFHRMNRELGASIDTAKIKHVARYNRKWRRVEICARFEQDQEINIEPLGSTFHIKAGEMILTEISRKFRLEQMVPYLSTFGLSAQQIFSDRRERFAVLLLRRM